MAYLNFLARLSIRTRVGIVRDDKASIARDHKADII